MGLFAFWKFKLPRRNMITATNFELFILKKKTKENKLSCFYHCLVIQLILNQKVLIMSGLKLCSCLVLKWNMNFIFINI